MAIDFYIDMNQAVAPKCRVTFNLLL